MKRLELCAVLLLAACHRPDLKLSVTKSTLLANGYDSILLRIDGTNENPKIQISGNRLFCTLLPAHSVEGHWEATLNAGVLPGTLHIKIASRQQSIVKLVTLEAQTTDGAADGTPDFLRLEDDRDQQVFRRWMTDLAELQYFIPAGLRPPEIIDCSSLVRYSYREALRNHDAAWVLAAKLPFIEANVSIKKYSYPHTLLGPKLFRTREGNYHTSDLNDGTFAEFADAKTLQRFNTFLVSRDVHRAQPGDILFYRRKTPNGISYHSMIFIGRSRLKPDAEIYVVYHTGPDGSSDGTIRRITLSQLLHFPEPQWQPIAANETFLGVYRWNILKITP